MPVTTEVPERANPKTTTVRGVLFECSMGNIPLAALMIGFSLEINQSQTSTFCLLCHIWIGRRKLKFVSYSGHLRLTWSG